MRDEERDEGKVSVVARVALLVAGIMLFLLILGGIGTVIFTLYAFFGLAGV